MYEYFLIGLRTLLYHLWLIRPSRRGTTCYTIRETHHYSNGTAVHGCSSALYFTVRFDESVRYLTHSLSNQWDINKLWGFHEGWGDDHSARIGFRWADGRLTLHPYVHAGGTNYGKMDPRGVEVAIGEEVACYVAVGGNDRYYLGIRDQHFEYPRDKAAEGKVRYQAYPYFGGDEPSPQDIRVWITPRAEYKGFRPNSLL